MARQSRPKVVVLNTNLIGMQYVIKGSQATFGRSPDCEILLDQGSVSRQHARLTEREGQFTVCDLGSRNGITVNGQTVREIPLRHGDILAVGEVKMRFEFPSAGKSVSVSEEERPLKAGDLMGYEASNHALVSPTQANPVDTERPFTVIGLNLKLILIVVIALLVSVALGVMILRRTSGDTRPRLRKLSSVLISAGEAKWISLKGVGGFSEGAITVEDTDVVSAAKFFDGKKTVEGELLLQGKSGGEATVFVQTEKNIVVSIRVLVRGRIEDPLEEYARLVLSSEERRRWAEQFFSTGLVLEKEQPYRAMIEYKKTAAVLSPLAEKGQIYMDAKTHAAIMKSRIADIWDEKTKEITAALANNDLSRGVQLLDETMVLIPDTKDPRHQKAWYYRRQVMREQLRAKGARKRG